MAPARTHSYTLRNVWTGNEGSGTSHYRSYSRDHDIAAPEKYAPLLCSSDRAFRGDATRYSPEELLVASLSGCHMLWYLHLCADAGVVIAAYEDDATATMQEESDGSGRFVECTLRPVVTIEDGAHAEQALRLHEVAHEKCFIARSVTFPVHVRPRVNAVKTL